jgi:hypothetical protein
MSGSKAAYLANALRTTRSTGSRFEEHKSRAKRFDNATRLTLKTGFQFPFATS